MFQRELQGELSLVGKLGSSDVLEQECREQAFVTHLMLSVNVS